MRGLLAFMALTFASQASATECRNEVIGDTPYTICEVDMTRDRLELFLQDESGRPYGYFGVIAAALEAEGLKLGFATNAGMYHVDRRPVGYYVENGTEEQSLVTKAGPGNFGLLPNGVFCLRDGRADVYETQAFLRAAPKCRSATQSGPMLVIEGALHPRFLVDSTSTFIRSGVGTTADGTRAIFAISDAPVTFHTFGTLFRDHLKTPNALFLDGNISRLRAPDLGRSGTGFTRLGPILGVIESAE
ncbi:MAG: phosphodiester glycosidase family protein [Pseudomonadota bacterium]